jgi:hypothetical protein
MAGAEYPQTSHASMKTSAPDGILHFMIPNAYRGAKSCLLAAFSNNN